MKTFGLILAGALCMTCCRDRVRIHTEVPRVTEEHVRCSVYTVVPWVHTECTPSGKGTSCHLVTTMQTVAHPGVQRARVTRTTYSWNYVDAKPNELPQVDEDVNVVALEHCR